MAYLRVLVVLPFSSTLLGSVDAVRIADMEQGAAFTQCISVTDFTTKTLSDDITLVDREASGCCPDDTVPGAKFTSQYQGPQIVCGFEDDATISFSTGSSNGDKTCTYNNCFVMKQDILCADDTKQLLNGCCGANPQTNFDDLCSFYDSSFDSVYGDATAYCTTYAKTYEMEYTSDKTDDITDGNLNVEKVYTYTPCASSMIGGGGSSGGSASTTSYATKASAVGLIASMLTIAVAY